MFILVLNAGSSSVKYQLFEMENKKVLAKGLCERIGIDGSRIVHKTEGNPDYVAQMDMPTHTYAIKALVDALTDSGHGVIRSMDEINAIGHRIVHGGPYFTQSTIVDANVIKELEGCIDFAPLHTEPHLMGIRGCLEYMPDTPQVLVFDTTFHQTMPKHAFMYPVPKKFYEEYKIRRYGFHGTSHKYVSELAGNELEKAGCDKSSAKIVTCHLGNGSSISAVKGGKCADTSMGFTPLEGIIMGSRIGVMDPAVVPFIMEKENMNPAQVRDFMNKECGMLGVSGISSDLREIMDARAAGNEDAALTFDILCYGIKKYIGSYSAAMGGLDAIVFTAGIGENNSEVRAGAVEGLEFLGVKIDAEKNRNAKQYSGDVIDVSAPDSKVKIFVIPTNEELVIASDTERLTRKG